MTATAKAYRTPYVSQMLQEPDRTWDDCCASVTIMLANDWTLGEWYIRDDGRPRDVHVLRNTIRKRIGDTDGSLTLHDSNDMMHELDPGLPDLPRYNGQATKPGQSAAGATLRLTWDEFKAMLRDGHSAALCGLSGTVGHVIHVTDGNATGALVKDPLTRKPPAWPGERWSWDKLRRFTSASDWQYGSATAIACAVVKVGDQTQAKRAEAEADKVIARRTAMLEAQRAQTTLHREERDAARGEYAALVETSKSIIAGLEHDLAACRAATPADCSDETDRALAAEQKVRDAIAVLTR